MKRFQPQKLNKKKDHRRLDVEVEIVRVLITPVLLPVLLIIRFYRWLWDYDYLK